MNDEELFAIKLSREQMYALVEHHFSCLLSWNIPPFDGTSFDHIRVHTYCLTELEALLPANDPEFERIRAKYEAKLHRELDELEAEEAAFIAAQQNGPAVPLERSCLMQVMEEE